MTAAKKLAPLEARGEGPALTPKTYDRLVQHMYNLAGVHLPASEKNLSLLKNRLSKILRKEGMTSYEALADAMDHARPELLEQFISALTTNKTHFFREDAHFNFLKTQLATHFQRHADLRIWCAAASTGQEPYTIGMVVKEAVPQAQHRNCRILATDIDLDVLEKAVEGNYTAAEMEGVPPMLRNKYFEASAQKATYRAKQDLASMIHFSRFNLIQDNYDFKNKFHFVFCRNVLIYFDPPTVKQVIHSLASSLLPEGYLILGHSESGTVNDPQIKAMSQATYKKIG